MRTLFAGKNNQLKDRLATSDDNGVTWVYVDLTAVTVTAVVLEIYDTAGTALISLDAKGAASAQFALTSGGLVTWTPSATAIASSLVGKHNCRYVVKTSTQAQGVVFEAGLVEIKA